MTNQEWLCSLSAEEFLNNIKWLLQNYGKRWTDSDPAIIEWLQSEHEVNTPEDKGMTNDEAIHLLVNATYSEEWQGNEELQTAHNMAIKALEQADVLDKIKEEIERQEKWLIDAGYNAYNVDLALDAIKLVISESEDKE